MDLWRDPHYIAEVQPQPTILPVYSELSLESLERILSFNDKINFKKGIIIIIICCVAKNLLGLSQKIIQRICHLHSMCHKPETHEGRGKHDNEIILLSSRRTY